MGLAHVVGAVAYAAGLAWLFLDADQQHRWEFVIASLAVARMGAHITYLSDAALHRKFGRKFQDRENPSFSFDADFEVESYLRHQGSSFVDRFDANSYLYLTRAMDYFDLAADAGGVLAKYQDTGSPLMSGYLLGEKLINGKAAALDAEVGAGHLVMLGFRPQWRGQTMGTFKVIFNALLR